MTIFWLVVGWLCAGVWAFVFGLAMGRRAAARQLRREAFPHEFSGKGA